MDLENIRILKASKSYENSDFIASPDGRTIRMLSEYLYPTKVFRENGVAGTIVFFGSARTLSGKEFEQLKKELSTRLATAKDEEKALIEAEIALLEKKRPMIKYYDDAVEMAERFSKWSLNREKDKQYFIMTGGGPGFMEAANKGAYNVGAPSIGMNISLPFEQYPNQFLSPELNFEFHYFFMRKYWFIDTAKAVVVMPGGAGTLDELMDIITLLQTTKVERKIPIVLYNEEFWKNVINFNYLIEQGMMKKEDLSLFIYADTPDETFNYITKKIVEAENE